MTITYEPDAGLVETIFSWKGTVLPSVVREPLFWIVMLLHGIFWGIDYFIRYQCFEDYGTDGTTPDSTQVCLTKATGKNLPAISWKAISLGTSLLTFFLVFYSVQSYNRFYALYGNCVGLGGGIMEWSSLIKQYLPNDAGVQWNCVRFMHAAMAVEYYGLRDSGVDDDEWKIIKERNLLTAEEVEKMKGYTGFKPFLPVYWALEECKKSLWVEGTTTKSNVLKMQLLEDKALTFRGHTSTIINSLKQPVPFPYFHVLNLILFLALGLLSYVLVGQAHISLSFPVLAIYMLCVLGLKCIAVGMADPFGDDAVDFELETFMKGAMTNSIAKLTDNYVPRGDKLPSEIINPLGSTESIEPHHHSVKETNIIEDLVAAILPGGSRKVNMSVSEVDMGVISEGDKTALNKPTGQDYSGRM